MTRHEGAGFPGDFSHCGDLLAAKPYADTARRKRSPQREKDPKSIFESPAPSWRDLVSPSPEAIITILSDRNYMDNLYSEFLVLKQMQAMESGK